MSGMEGVIPYNFDTVARLDNVPNDDPELQEFLLHQPQVTPAQFDEFQRYVTAHMAPRTPQQKFTHPPYEQRPAPGKSDKHREASKEYRARKKEAFKKAETQLAQANEDLAGKDKQIQTLAETIEQLTRANQALLDQRDGWRRKYENLEHSIQQQARSTPNSNVGDRLSPSPNMLPPGSVASSGHPGPTQSAAAGGPGSTGGGTVPGTPAEGGGAAGRRSTPSGSDHDSFLREAELQDRFRYLEELVERPDATDQELGEATGALLDIFHEHNEISAEMADRMVTPEYQLYNYYLNPGDIDLREESIEEKREEMNVIAQIHHRAGFTQEQFERVVSIRHQFVEGLRTILRERMNINKELREYFIAKLGYIRRMCYINIRSTATDVMHAAQLLAKLRATFTAVTQLRERTVRALFTNSNPRQGAIMALQTLQPSIYTSVALSAMTQLQLIQHMDNKPLTLGGQ